MEQGKLEQITAKANIVMFHVLFVTEEGVVTVAASNCNYEAVEKK